MNFQCSEDKIIEFLDGNLSPSERTALETHLGVCDECAKTLREVQRGGEFFRGLNPRPIPNFESKIIELILSNEKFRKPPLEPLVPDMSKFTTWLDRLIFVGCAVFLVALVGNLYPKVHYSSDSSPLLFPAPRASIAFSPAVVNPQISSISLRNRETAESFFIKANKEADHQNYFKARELVSQAIILVPSDNRYPRSLNKIERFIQIEHTLGSIRNKLTQNPTDAWNFYIDKTQLDLDLFVSTALKVAGFFENRGETASAASILICYGKVRPFDEKTQGLLKPLLNKLRGS